MTSPQERYAELLALTQLYLLQEYSPKDRITTDRNTFTLFRNYAVAQKQVHTPPSPPPIPTPATAPIALAAAPTAPTTTAATASPPLHRIATPTTTVSAIVPTSTPSSAPALASPTTDTTKKPPILHPTAFVLEPPEAVVPPDFNELKKIIAEKLPHINLIDAIPNDNAVHIGTTEGTPVASFHVVVLLFGETPKQQQFLVNIGKALDAYGVHTGILHAHRIEQQQQGWETLFHTKSLRLIIGCSHGIEALPKLLNHYHEAGKQGKHHHLGNIPFLPLSDIGFYMKEPSLKPPLWKAIRDCLHL